MSTVTTPARDLGGQVRAGRFAIGDWLLRGFVALLVGVLLPLPERFALWLGARVADGVYWLVRATRYRDFMPANVRAAFPGLDARAVDRLVRRHLQLLFQSLVEVIRMPRLNAGNIGRKVQVQGLDRLLEARRRGKGTILVTAHFGNWELLGFTLGLMGYPMLALVQRQSKGAFDRFLKARRSMHGNQVLENDLHGTQEALRRLQRNGTLFLVADQHGEGLRAIVPFFGHPVSAQVGPMAFAMKTGAEVLPAFIIRQKGGRHCIIIEAPLPLSQSGDKHADLQQNCARMMAVFERYIRAHPDHWLWAHNRWDKLERAREGLRRRRPVAS
ncbi:MAG: lysophospholipid acyltransferase family protein [Firmicutes bacterium]|nr:lysophospholipid acyltransferase family protein [Bacillota bacterium]